jgi:hypothetical protein
MPTITITLTDDEMRGLKNLAENQRRYPAQQAAFLVAIGIEAYAEDSQEPYTISGSPRDPGVTYNSLIKDVYPPADGAVDRFVTGSASDPNIYTEAEMEQIYAEGAAAEQRATENPTQHYSIPTGRRFRIDR